MFTCCNCGKESNFIGSSCPGCHRPLCRVCLERRKSRNSMCKDCVNVSEKKADTFSIYTDYIDLEIHPTANKCVIIGIRHRSDYADIVLSPVQVTQMITWLQGHI